MNAWRTGAAAGQTLHEVRRALAQALRKSGIPNADLDARLLLQQAAGLSHAALIAEERERVLNLREAAQLADMLRRRLAGEPVSRILGRREFMGREFLVSPDVLDPRPETELLVEAALRLRTRIEALHEGAPLICDAGTGSGCVIVSLLAEWPAARGLALDISQAALRVARRNAEHHAVGDRLACVRGDWLNAVGGPLDVLVSNPPYLRADEMRALPREVRHDPPTALAAGDDGLAAYRALALHAADVLRPGGWLLLEVGRGQAEDVQALFQACGFVCDGAALPAVLPDLAGIPRVVALRRAD